MREKMMRAAVFKGEGRVVLEEVPRPVVENADDVILEVEACSICGTDVHILNVPPAFKADTGIALGHELAARVVETGEGVTTLEAGDRVIVRPNIYCGTCWYCRNGMNNQCENMVSLGVHTGGGFAEYCKAPERVCYKITPGLPTEIAVFAEPLACVLGGLTKLDLMPSRSAVIIGGGPIALIYLLMLKAAGIGPVILSEFNETRLEAAKKMGADITVNPKTQNLKAEVRKHLPRGADIAIDVVGSQMHTAISCVRPRGTVLLFGLNLNAEVPVRQSDITLREIDVKGTYVDDATFDMAVDILEKGLIDLKPLITHTISLERLLEGVDLLRTGKGMEIIVLPNGERTV